ncbi:hypothetical protein Godav_000815 [Gossypium davidsonii]|uniref:DUF4283 domain-containing protein n=1 Tax=Gossypium davidsonii TaxID=34287 RepID=A0A7J8T1R6_GOSDV|nr:hypothetical protein [Gossypium davidsonii]
MEDYMASFSLEEVEKDSIQLGVESVDNGISYANCFVRKNGPWNFNSHLLVLHRSVQGENSLTLQLTEVNFWILVNDIPYVQLAYKGIMRLRVWLDVGIPLKRKKKLLLSNEYKFKWDISLRAQSRRTAALRSQWLVKDGGRQGPSYGNSRNNNGRSNLVDLQDGFRLGHCVNTVSDSFDDEMAIREEENSPMHNLDRLSVLGPFHLLWEFLLIRIQLKLRGLERPRTLQRLWNMLRDSNPSVVFLIETKLQGSRLERIRCKCGYINRIDVDPNGRIIGDFNEIAYMLEKRGGLVRQESQMRKFRDMLSDCVISNLRYTRQWFTWEKGHTASNNIHERLDRAVVNDEWWSLFSNYKVSHLSHFFSDHCPLLLNSKVESLSTKVHHFRFEAAWLLEDSCETMVKKLWEASSGTIPTRLHKVGEGLDKWFTRVKRERSMSRKDLERQLQRLNELTPSDKVLRDIADTKLALSLEADKELYWEQRV